MKTLARLIVAALAAGSLHFAHADHHESKSEASHSSAGLFQSVFQRSYASETDKIVQLAETFSEENYDWRPADGVRSVRETILHVSAANFFIGSQLGMEIPEGVKPRELEKTVKGKKATIDILKKSLQFAEDAAAQVKESELGDNIKMFGQEMPKMAAVMALGGHAQEHLGQLIAYARSNDVTPPWSQ